MLGLRRVGAEPGTSVTRCGQCGGAGQVQQMGRSIFGTVVTMHPCGACEGTGEVAASPCPECRGAGRLAGHRSIPVDVPAGVDDGMQLRVQDAGEDGRAGGPPGDLSITMRVSPHPVFERRGQDLACVLAIPMTTAALGGRVDIEILDGARDDQARRRERRPARWSASRARACPTSGGGDAGDLLVTIMVETPKPGSKDERRLLEQLADLRGEESGGPGRLRRFFEP